jgi:hypothetical protein
LTKPTELLLDINYESCSTLISATIYEYWAVGCSPILLLSCPGTAAGFVEQPALGLTAEPSDVAGIHQAILTVYRQSKTAAPLQVSTTGVEAHDHQALTRKLVQVLSTV